MTTTYKGVKKVMSTVCAERTQIKNSKAALKVDLKNARAEVVNLKRRLESTGSTYSAYDKPVPDQYRSR